MYYSLTKWRGLTPTPTYIGLENFEKLLGDDLFWNALKHNLIYLVSIPAITIAISLYLAFLLTHGKARFRKFYRITFFFPQVMSLVAIGVLWSFIYHPTIGILSSIAGFLGAAEPIAWLGNPDLALAAIGGVVIWQAVGFYVVLFMAGMDSIPVSYYEAATIDGATRWDLFWKNHFAAALGYYPHRSGLLGDRGDQYVRHNPDNDPRGTESLDGRAFYLCL